MPEEQPHEFGTGLRAALASRGALHVDPPRLQPLVLPEPEIVTSTELVAVPEPARLALAAA